MLSTNRHHFVTTHVFLVCKYLNLCYLMNVSSDFPITKFGGPGLPLLWLWILHFFWNSPSCVFIFLFEIGLLPFSLDFSWTLLCLRTLLFSVLTHPLENLVRGLTLDVTSLVSLIHDNCLQSYPLTWAAGRQHLAPINTQSTFTEYVLSGHQGTPSMNFYINMCKYGNFKCLNWDGFNKRIIF